MSKDVFTKDELYARLQNLRNSFFLGWAACYILNQEEVHKYFSVRIWVSSSGLTNLRRRKADLSI